MAVGLGVGSARERSHAVETGAAWDSVFQLAGRGLFSHAPYRIADLARRFPGGADFVLQTHYHPSGKVETERTRIGLHFADAKPERTLLEFQVPPEYGYYAGIDIPAGEAHYPVTETFTLPVDVQLVNVGGHAHYLCSKMIGRARIPGADTEPLLYIDDWDFNWQGWYDYREPLYLPAGTVVDAELIYDNSENNPRNPNHPPKRTTWGFGSTDEMGSLIFLAVPVNEDDVPWFHLVSAARLFASGGDDGTLRLLAAFRRMDRNGDGAIDHDEVRDDLRETLDGMDRNGNGKLDPIELDALEARARAPR